ncbi:GPW/gp25 family protein [Emticicia sp. 17c]|uniref:GPW/gp25 family protein n=1 Tax=Emticicia sp. 17c TaxID=3127704 RepID=UPI00301CDDE1
MDKKIKYYNLPLNIASFIQHKNADEQLDDDSYVRKSSIDKIDLDQSIRLNLRLILRTRLKSCRFDPEFGYLGWSKDFENITNESNWEKLIKEDFKQKIIEYERRLVDIRVNISLKKNTGKSTSRSHQFMVKVDAKFKFTSNSFEFEELMYFSPIRISFKY